MNAMPLCKKLSEEKQNIARPKWAAGGNRAADRHSAIEARVVSGADHHANRTPTISVVGKNEIEVAGIAVEAHRAADKYEPSYRLVQEVDQQIAEAKTALAAEDQAPLRDETTEKDQNHEWAKAELVKAQLSLTPYGSRATAMNGNWRVPVTWRINLATEPLNKKSCSGAEDCGRQICVVCEQARRGPNWRRARSKTHFGCEPGGRTRVLLCRTVSFSSDNRAGFGRYCSTGLAIARTISIHHSARRMM